MPQFLPPLADIWETVFTIVVFVLIGIGRLFLGGDDAPKPKQKPRRPRPKPQGQPQQMQPQQMQPQPPAAGGRRPAGDPLRDEIEQFLRRAQGKPEPQPRPDEPPQRVPIGAGPGRQRRQPTRKQPPRKRSVSLEPVQLEPVHHNEGVAEHVSKHLGGTKALAEHAKHLGDEVALADDKIELHLKEKFDHRLGTLRGVESVPSKKQASSSIASDLLEMMARPNGMAQLVVASEILKRPTDRFL